MFVRFLPFVFLLVFGGNTLARQNPALFEIPIDCKFGNNCDLVLFVDHDKSAKWKDFQCGSLSYNNHQGTDIRLRSIKLMQRGVDVLAAADGRVIKIRRGLPDISFRAIGHDIIVRRGLGNVVVLDHGNGWRTIYAHLKNASIRVATGQEVKAGNILGQVGMSGLSEFPHLHFAVQHQGKVVDPFSPEKTDKKRCAIKQKTLWSAKAKAQLRYKKAFVLQAGFSDSAKFNRVALTYGLDIKDRMERRSPNFVFAIEFGGGRTGDEYEMSLISPGAKILARSKKKITRITNIKFDFVGRKGYGRVWPKGTYKGRFELFRTEQGIRRKVLETERIIQVP